MLVRELMSTDVVAVDADRSVRAAVLAMFRAGVGSVIVNREGVPAGILTETDALVAAAKTERPLQDIALESAMTEDLVTGRADMTVRSAVRRMNEHGVTKLPITEDFDVVGVLTMTDVVHSHASLIKEAHRAERRSRGRWDPE
ncbi:MAG: CBS domain-containing protein [Halanaeroarchaeum sp.]